VKEAPTNGTSAGQGAKEAPQPPSPTKSKALNSVLGKETEDVTKVFSLGKVLGRGQFGTTREAVERQTGKMYACKSISKRKLITPEDIHDVQREVQIMHHLAGHQNITRLKGSYEDKGSVHLVMEICSGGELFDRIVQRGHYTEKDAAGMVRTIVNVVAHCHSLGVMHRDLKPENFLLADKSPEALLKATDFGLSVFYKPGQVFRDIVGSAYYVAPEVLKRHYGPEADLWSCGVILYILLSGVPPFWGETEQQIFDSILKGHIDFHSDPWPSISSGAKNAVTAMLQQAPRKRANAEQILKHEWMKENGSASDKPLDNVILNRMRGFAGMNKLKKEALKVIATGMSPEEIAGLKALFVSMDTDNSGTITADELREAMKKQGSPLVQEELQRLLESIDVDATGSIDYGEFLAATVNLSQLEKEENMFKAFQFFDKDSSGYITTDELEEALKGVGGTQESIREVLEEVDKDGDGRIDYDEFCVMMRGSEAPATNAKQKGAQGGPVGGGS